MLNKRDLLAELDDLRPENRPDLFESLAALKPRDEFQLGAEPPPPPQRNALEEFDRKG